MKKRTFFTWLFLLTLLLTGCQMDHTAPSSSTDEQMQIIDLTDASEKGSDRNCERNLEEIIQKAPEIYDVIVIKGNEETLITYKVKHMQRFRMKKIEKELKEQLTAAFPESSFTVSSDFKIYLESNRLKRKLDQGDLSREKAENRLKEIIQLSKEKT